MVELKIGEEIQGHWLHCYDTQLIITGIPFQQGALISQMDRCRQEQPCRSACDKAAGLPCPIGCDCLEVKNDL